MRSNEASSTSNQDRSTNHLLPSVASRRRWRLRTDWRNEHEPVPLRTRSRKCNTSAHGGPVETCAISHVSHRWEAQVLRRSVAKQEAEVLSRFSTKRRTLPKDRRRLHSRPGHPQIPPSPLHSSAVDHVARCLRSPIPLFPIYAG